jgi:PAS domain S-box-containing protein
MARLIRHFDWSKTDLGPIEAWPQYLRAAVETIVQSPAAMILLSGPGGVMIYNDGYAEIAGLRHPSILGVPVRAGWPEIADFNSNVLRVCLGGQTLTYHNQEFGLLRNNVPETAWFDIYYSPVYDSSGQAQAVMAVIHETTNRVLLEQQRDHAEKALRASNLALRRANADLEQFAFSASHDLKEPLRMVSVYTELLKRKLAGKLDHGTEMLLNYCIEGAGRLDALINDLLEYTRASAEPDADAPAISAESVVEHTLTILAPSILECGAHITVGPLPELKIQSVHLQQIFQNLIGNAIKYRSHRPVRIHVSARNEADIWTFSVEDNGIGIDPIYKDQVFGLFKRLHVSSEYSGTGLGLAICKKLVDRYGGRIWIDSRPNEGSTFCFTLPLAQQPISIAATAT